MIVSLTNILILVIWFSISLGSNTRQASRYKSADYCRSLRNVGLNHVIVPDSERYTERVKSYWSVTSQLAPSCFIQPENTRQISAAVKALVHETGCKFAIRSGGHSSNAGANNIEDGVTIDLSLLNSISVDLVTKVVSVEPGVHWLSAYQALDPVNISVPGGRIGIVGAGGLLLGGGCSHFMYRVGLACDSVVGHEVVLANGSIIYANTTQHADLHRALKGGGNNFGIVARYYIQGFARKPIWGGSTMYEESVGEHFISAIKHWTDGLEEYPDGSAVVWWSYAFGTNRTVIRTGFADVAGRVKAPAFDELLAVKEGKIEESFGVSNMSTMALGTQASGYRNIWFTATFKNDERIIAKAVALHKQLVDEMKAESSDGDFETQCFFQPFPAFLSKLATERGGNILGLDRHKDDALVLLGSLAVKGIDQETIGRHKMMRWKDDIENYSKELEAWLEYKYMNYADASQDVLASYGEENAWKLKEVSEKYDPGGIFQTRVSGVFKLGE